ncbi:hypothetical protein [Paenarthrobacter sp. YIM B13468]|uniref:hypothetical protein n=1 Tax=Paenarthrobacter sp. YIM B13468 TaxID=3366295 RepID=UPI00366F330D
MPERTIDPTTSTEFQDNDRCGLEELRQGERINAWEGNVLISAGVVDLAAPSLGIVWIQQDGLRERKLILCQNYDLHRGPAGQWDLFVDDEPVTDSSWTT